ncbi:MAG: hypothetical protein HY866_19070 [Chloroflexi bacterium]|nr:hypothetical protein [Chloroflexota bacterium]
MKRTYDVNHTTGMLTPASTALPVFDSDQTLPADDAQNPTDQEIIQYEHDLAGYKPEADLIVWRFIGAVGTQQVRVNGNLWLQRAIAALDLPLEYALFGWEPRIDSPRATEGAFPTDENAYPLPAPLPAGFNNRFYNGYLRAAALAAPFAYFPPGASITIIRAGVTDYRTTLRTESLTATYYVYSGSGPDVEERWQPHAVTMNNDTVVISPQDDQCYVVWRGVWPFANHPETDYRRLEVTLQETS